MDQTAQVPPKGSHLTLDIGRLRFVICCCGESDPPWLRVIYRATRGELKAADSKRLSVFAEKKNNLQV